MIKYYLRNIVSRKCNIYKKCFGDGGLSDKRIQRLESIYKFDELNVLEFNPG